MQANNLKCGVGVAYNSKVGGKAAFSWNLSLIRGMSSLLQNEGEKTFSNPRAK